MAANDAALPIFAGPEDKNVVANEAVFSTKLFHSLHDGQHPTHFILIWAQLVHLKFILFLAIEHLYFFKRVFNLKILRFIYTKTGTTACFVIVGCANKNKGVVIARGLAIKNALGMMGIIATNNTNCFKLCHVIG